jgi:glutamyl-tRNA synthetase
VPKKTEPADALALLTAACAAIAEVNVVDEAATEARLRALADELGVKAGNLFMPIRVAATGRTQSPGLFETLRVIGNDRLLARLDRAVSLLNAHIQSGGAAGD